MSGFNKHHRRTLTAMLLAWEGLFIVGGYHVADEWQGKESSSVRIVTDILEDAARTPDLNQPVTVRQVTESISLAFYGGTFATGAPGFEVGRGIYHLTHCNQRSR